MNNVILDHEKTPGYDFHWTCEKWSEDACDFARKMADGLGISHVVGHVEQVMVPKDRSVIDKILFRPEQMNTIIRPALVPIKTSVPSWVLRALVGAPEEIQEIHGNLLLNEGIQRFMDMTMIATLTGTGWNNANAFLGVGDSSTAEAATQTELQAATNRFYKAMNATYPSRSGQTSSFQSDFTSTEANYVWAEWAISSGATTASGSGFTTGTTNLNRKVAALGTKSTGTWTLTGQVTFS